MKTDGDKEEAPGAGADVCACDTMRFGTHVGSSKPEDAPVRCEELNHCSARITVSVAIRESECNLTMKKELVAMTSWASVEGLCAAE